MNNDKYFTQVEAIEWYINSLDEYGGYYEDLHDNVFNNDYYIIGTHRAEKALEQYGVFKAINTIVEDEEMMFGETQTDFTNPEQVANKLWYIIGLEAIHDFDIRIREFYYEIYDLLADDENNAKFIDVLETVLKETIQEEQK